MPDTQLMQMPGQSPAPIQTGSHRRNTLGILSICFFWLPMVGLVLGIISLAVRERTAALGIIGIVLSILAPVFAISVLGIGCASCAGMGVREVGEFAEEASCQANMRSIAAGEAMYHGKFDRYGSLAELSTTGIMSNAASLECPACESSYILDCDTGSYTVTCPCQRHGSVVDGVLSWL